MNYHAQQPLERQDSVDRLIETATDYTKIGMEQLRRLRFWMRARRQAAAAPVPTDELSERRELRRQRQELVDGLAAPIGGTAVPEAASLVPAIAIEPSPEFVNTSVAAGYTTVPQLPYGLSLRETFPDADLTQLPADQLLGWLNQDRPLF